MSISNRLIGGFGLIVVLMIILGLYCFSQLARVRDSTDRVVTRDITMISRLAVLAEARNEMRATRETAVRMALMRNRADFDGIERDWRAAHTRTRAALESASTLADQYGDTAISEERAAIWRNVGATLDRMDEELQAVERESQQQLSALRAGDLVGALALEEQLMARSTEFQDLTASVRQVAEEGAAVGQARVTSIYNESRVSIIAASIIAIVLAALIVYFLRRSIIGPLGAFMEFVERIGRSDLSGAPAPTGADEIGRLGVTLNTMVGSLRDVATQSRDATSNLGAAISEIRASTQEQAAGVEEQLAAVQETAATVDEITHAGSQVTKRAQEVIASAQATAQTSIDGTRAAEETTRAMDTIREQAEIVAQNIVALSEKTQAISDIISVVNDISERSHLLALNAAIEAAAAGESGRSFAVVAAEMKQLADQAKGATTQVRSILGDIQRGINTSVMLTEEAVKRTDAGKQRTEVTQRTIGEMSARVRESVQTFQQIVASTNQQQLGIEQVMGALQNIRQASTQTAAGTRQLDEAAANLAELSRALEQISQRYRL